MLTNKAFSLNEKKKFQLTLSRSDTNYKNKLLQVELGKPGGAEGGFGQLLVRVPYHPKMGIPSHGTRVFVPTNLPK